MSFRSNYQLSVYQINVQFFVTVKDTQHWIKGLCPYFYYETFNRMLSAYFQIFPKILETDKFLN
jgi:hypothetical protein